MFARLVAESFVRNPRRKILTAAALVVGMAVATSTLTVALDVGDRLAREFRSFGANLLVTPQSDTLPVEIGGVDYRPVDEGSYLQEADLGKLKTIFWRHNIVGFTPVPRTVPARIVNETEKYPGFQERWSEPGMRTMFRFRTARRSKPASASRIRGGKSTDAGSAMAPMNVSAGDGIFARFASRSSRHGPDSQRFIHRVSRDEISSSLTPLVVTGIVSTGDAEDKGILVPLSVAQKISGHAGEFRQLFVSALTKPADAFSERDPQSMTPTEYDRWFCSPYISSISLQIRQVLPGVDVRTIRRVADTEGRILSHIGMLLWMVTLAALLAAALAVAATSATTVLERRAEVGIMKAIGATNALVAGIFLAEQVMLAIAGGAIGFVLGVGLARILGQSVFGTPASLRIVLLPVVLGLAATVAVLGCLIPLRRAAHFNPAPILRGE